MDIQSEKKLIISYSNINFIKNYGVDNYLIYKYVDEKCFDFEPKDNRVLSDFEYPEEEIKEFLNEKPALYERIRNKTHCDTIYVDCYHIDNDLIKILIDNLDKKIILFGLLNNIIDINLLKELLSSGNCLYNCDYEINDGLMLSLFKNKPNSIIKSNKSEMRIYFNNNNSVYDCLECLEEYFDKNNMEKFIIEIEVDNIDIIYNLQHFLEKLDELNINCVIEYKISKEVESILSRNYSHYYRRDNYKGINNKIKQIVSTSDNLLFDTVCDYIEFMQIIDVIFTRIPENASDLDKVVYISRFVTNYMSYVKHDDLYTNYTILRDGVGVCRDYANITAYLLNRLGVRCEYVVAYNYDKYNKPGHAFNVVYLDEKPYFLDNTWETGGLFCDSHHFLVSYEEFKKYHSIMAPDIDFEIHREDCQSTYHRFYVNNSEYKIEKYASNYIISEEQLKKLISQERYEKLDSALKSTKYRS